MPEVLSTHAVSTAANLAAMLLLLRDQRGRREQQVLAFGAFLSELGGTGLDLRVVEGGMTVEGVATGSATVRGGNHPAPTAAGSGQPRQKP